MTLSDRSFGHPWISASLVSAFVLGLALLGCGGAKTPQAIQQETVQKTMESIPEWFPVPPADGEHLFGTGTGESGDMQFAVNKADRPGADRLVLELEQAVRMELGLQAAAPGWQVEVVAVSALHGDGLDSLYDVLARHGEHVRAHPPARREPRDRLARLLSDEIGRRLAKRIGGAQSGALEALLSELDAGRVSVFKAAAQVLTDAELLAELVAPGEDTR